MNELKIYIQKMCLMGVMLCLPMAMEAMAQDDGDPAPRWAIDAQLGIAAPVVGTNGLRNAPLYAESKASPSGVLTKIRGEYFVPGTRFSMKVGYEHERMDMLQGDAETAFGEIMAGPRWYPGRWTWAVQPFVGVDALIGLGQRHDSSGMVSSAGYGRQVEIRNPRLSIGPVVGADLYLLSHVALQVEYGFRMGIDSRMTVTTTFSRNGGESYLTQTRLHRHAFAIGLKAVFPFRFTSGDGCTLVDLIDGLLTGNP